MRFLVVLPLPIYYNYRAPSGTEVECAVCSAENSASVSESGFSSRGLHDCSILTQCLLADVTAPPMPFTDNPRPAVVTLQTVSPLLF